MDPVREFNASAHSYDVFSDIQKEVGLHLLDYLDTLPFGVTSLVDLGCGTGWFTLEVLRRLGDVRQVFGVDPAPNMLSLWQERLPNGKAILGRAEDPEVWAGLSGIDLVVANSSLHWVSDWRVLVDLIYGALREGGYWAFSVFARGSFGEIARALGIQFPADGFLSLEEVKGLVSERFALLNFEVMRLERQYNSLLDFLRFMKGTGARTERRFLSRARLRRAEEELRKACGALRAVAEVGFFLLKKG